MRELIIFTGPVHSEKTTHALAGARRHQRLGFNTILVRPTRSVRGHERPGHLVTKNGATFPSHDLGSATEIAELAAGYDVVWVDEPMLFEDEQVVFDVVQQLRRESLVLVSGLSATSELGAFGTSMPRLIAVADEVEFCKADCDRCGGYRTATRSICLKPKAGPVLVGGEETYEAACPSCWRAHVARVDTPTQVVEA